ncbi:hypothetical protein GGR55DRAFT_632792 [Xylaria sp. FL0064]|nr:hypothetical protein GGR55DRAFT_632792 [Xylaria sp. FL0064]
MMLIGSYLNFFSFFLFIRLSLVWTSISAALAHIHTLSLLWKGKQSKLGIFNHYVGDRSFLYIRELHGLHAR